MEPWKKRLREAMGYLELGMLEDAVASFQNIPPEDAQRLEVLAIRYVIATEDLFHSMSLTRNGNSVILYDMAITACLSGRHFEAKQLLCVALEINPSLKERAMNAEEFRPLWAAERDGKPVAL